MSTEPTDEASEPTDQTVVETAANAAEGVILARFANSDIKDIDITVTFDDGILDVDVYLTTTAGAAADADAVATEAVEAAEAAVDKLFE